MKGAAASSPSGPARQAQGETVTVPADGRPEEVALRFRHGVVCLVAVLGATSLASACGGGEDDGGGDDGGSTDPRCVELCEIDEPSLEGAYDVCSAESAKQCKASCDARIEDVSSACASCLLEDADFGLGGSSGFGDECSAPSPECGQGARCTIAGHGGECSYCEGDQAAEEACIRQAHPRREVDCDADFRDPAECAELCD